MMTTQLRYNLIISHGWFFYTYMLSLRVYCIYLHCLPSNLIYRNIATGRNMVLKLAAALVTHEHFLNYPSLHCPRLTSRNIYPRDVSTLDMLGYTQKMSFTGRILTYFTSLIFLPKVELARSAAHTGNELCRKYFTELSEYRYTVKLGYNFKSWPPGTCLIIEDNTPHP